MIPEAARWDGEREGERSGTGSFEGTLRGRSLIVSPDRILPGGGLEVRGGRIERVLVQGEPTSGPLCDLPGAVILPGLFNAHTHLELTRVASRIPGRLPLEEWLLEVRNARLEATREDISAGTREGLETSLSLGTTSLIDLAGTGDAAEIDHKIRRIVLREIIGFEPERGHEALEEARRWVEGGNDPPRGFAPHAPYSIDAGTIRAAARLSEDLELPWSIHLAEHPQEAQFLRAGSGPLAGLLERVGRSTSGWKPPGCGPVGYLDELGVLGPRALLAHSNYLEEGDVEVLARAGAAVVYCPRTHARFGHPPHPVESLIEAGVRVAIGTDSLASTEDLSVLGELAFARERHPRVSQAEWLRAATVNPHRATGGRLGTGTLEPGSPADVVALELPGSDPADPLPALLDRRRHPPVALVLVGGEPCR